MKKIMFMLAVIIAATFASCTSKPAVAEAADADSTVVLVDSVDSLAVDSVVADAAL